MKKGQASNLPKIEVTPEMVQAGVRALHDTAGISVDTDSVEVVITVFMAMIDAIGRSDDLDKAYWKAQMSEVLERVRQDAQDARR